MPSLNSLANLKKDVKARTEEGLFPKSFLTLNFNQNGWQTQDSFFDNGKRKSQNVYHDFTKLGFSRKRTKAERTKKDTKIYLYSISYLGLDRWVQNVVTAELFFPSQKKSQQKFQPAQFFYDSHGMINGKLGSGDEPDYSGTINYKHKCPIYFDTTHSGEVLSKQYITQTHSDFSKLSRSKIFYYQYNAQDQLRSGYSVFYLGDPLPPAQDLLQEIHDEKKRQPKSKLKLNVGQVLKVSAQAMLESKSKQVPRLKVDHRFAMPKPEPKLKVDQLCYYSPNRIISRYSPTNSDKKNEAVWDYYEDDLIPRTPQIYIADYGETFSSIAKKMFGDHRYGERIAANNGMLAISAPRQGLLLQLPQIIPERNKWDTHPSRPYHQFMDIITGSLVPIILSSPVKKKHHHGGIFGSFSGQILKLIVVGIAIYVAPELGVLFLNSADTWRSNEIFIGRSVRDSHQCGDIR